MVAPFLRHSREREAQLQSRMLDVLERRFRRRAAAAVLRHSLALVATYRELGYVPAVSDDAVQDMREVYREIATASARTFGQRMITQGKSAGLILETKAEPGVWSRLFQSVANAWVNLEPIRRRIVGVTETTRDQITRQVSRGQEEGLGVAQIAKQIEDNAPGISRMRGALIARTETHGAANHAMHQTAKATGLDLVKEWVATEDHRTRSISRDDAFDHLAMDGQTRPMDVPFDMPWVGGVGEPLKIMFPGEAGHPGGATINCLPPWALVRLAGLKRVMRCEYVGNLFEFSFAGPVNFTVTANHPVLTLAGWKAARHVVEGDKLIYGGIGHVVPFRADADVKNGHSRIDQLYNALKPLGDVVRADFGAVDFHGDVPHGNVDIVSARGALRDAMVSEGRRLLGEITFADAHVSKGLLLASRMVGFGSGAATDHANSGMGRFGPANAIFRGSHGCVPAVPFADAGPFDAEVRKACVNHASGHVQSFGNAVSAVPALKHGLDVMCDAFADNTPAFGGGSFEAVEVTAVKSRHYAGPVYNCETDSGLIISDGIVNHNCRCSVAHKVAGFD